MTVFVGLHPSFDADAAHVLPFHERDAMPRLRERVGKRSPPCPAHITTSTKLPSRTDGLEPGLPYELELRDTLDAALHRLTLLQDAAAECTELAGKLVRNGRIDHDAFQAKGRSQTRIFDHLDAFLASYARVSLLIFPVGKERFTKLPVPEDDE